MVIFVVGLSKTG